MRIDGKLNNNCIKTMTKIIETINELWSWLVLLYIVVITFLLFAYKINRLKSINLTSDQY